MNIGFLVGRLTRDPEKIEGLNLVKLVVAVADNYTKADGTRPVEYFNVSVWNKLADNCYKYLTKGSMVGIAGRWQNREYEAKDGTKKIVSEVVASDVEFLSAGKKKEELQEISLDDMPF